MTKDYLFELIRKEEVVIWAGAGFSLYAGYPSGKKLKDILFNSLSKSEQRHLRKSLLLPEFAENFFLIKGNSKNSLIRILNKLFVENTPISTEYHKKLASIPHIKTIITTNYDSLFEDAYKEKGQLIYSSKQIPYIEKGNTQIFKVHGDLSAPDSIIITKSDYINFFKDGSENDVFWTTIKERLATKNVLFMGYNIEDPNVESIFKKITESLNVHRRECFLVAPKLSQLKRNDLISKNINYINYRAETFIDELIANIKDNIISDQNAGFVSIDTFKDFLFNHKVLFELMSADESLKLKSIRGADATVPGNFKFTIKSDSIFLNDFKDFVSGKKVGELVLDNKNITNFNFNIGGIKLPFFDDGAKIIMKSIPQKSITVDFRFDNGFEFEAKAIDIFWRFPFFEVQFKLKSTQLKINFDFTNTHNVGVKLDYIHNRTCAKIKDEIEEFTFLNNLFNGNKFKVYWGDSVKHILQSVPVQPSMVKYSEFFIDYFNLIKIVEGHFDLRFKDIAFDTINQETYDLLIELVQIVKTGVVKYNWDGIVEATLFDYSDKSIKELEKINHDELLVAVTEREKKEVEIHNQKIVLGYKQVQIEEPFVSNFQDIKEGKEKEIKVVSKSKGLSFHIFRLLNHKNKKE